MKHTWSATSAGQLTQTQVPSWRRPQPLQPQPQPQPETETNEGESFRRRPRKGQPRKFVALDLEDVD